MRSISGWGAAAIVVVLLNGVGPSLAHSDVLADPKPISARPANLLCSHHDETGVQFLACDAYKEYHESVSPITHIGKTTLAIRYTFVPSFSTWSVVRAELDGSAAGWLTVKTEVNGKHGEAQQYVKTYPLTPAEAAQIVQTLDMEAAFSSASVNTRKGGCIDGTDMVVELANATRYKWFSLACGDEPDPRQESLNKLATVLISMVTAHADKSLGEFPGP